MQSPSIRSLKTDWLQNIKPEPFTEQDKSSAINILNIMAQILQKRDPKLSNEYFYQANHLQSLTCNKALAHLVRYLNPQDLVNIENIKSFLYLKKISEDLVLEEGKLLEKKLAEKVVMNMLQIVFYKALPCSLGGYCKYYPRKIVHKNDFLDVELGCYFYHHEKDRRRFVITESEKEFCYAGNFGDFKKDKSNKESGFSVNFFESLFHPLYYKNFPCVRTKCEMSVFCPYFHSEEEKTVWDVYFMEYFGKDRDVFTKKKVGDEERMRLKKMKGDKKKIYWKETLKMDMKIN